MFRIRKIHDDIIPVNKEAISQIQAILRSQFCGIPEEDITSLPEKLRNPLKYRFRTLLFVVDDQKGTVKGAALLLYAPDLNFCYLDYIAAAKNLTGSGVGGALYDRIRDEAKLLKCNGVFFECLPDDPKTCKDPVILKQNISRLRFYERYGARPIINTDYEMPIKPGDENMPYLVYDSLGLNTPPGRRESRKVVRAILERKYGNLCPVKYIEHVTKSFKDDPIKLREFRYIKKKPVTNDLAEIPHYMDFSIALIINDKHEIHHVRERGYVESPVRIKSIMKELEQTGYFTRIEPRHFSENHIRAVHDNDFVNYLKRCCTTLEKGKSLYPYVFPIRNSTRPPKELAIRAGYYCIDTFTPLNFNAFHAAVRSVDCAMTAARTLLEGYRLAYALVRPPGHHAEKRAFGGFCYFNSAAIAAHYLSRFGTVAVLDIDYHHGNGTQDIFYDRSDVLTISIHGHPRFAYPYFNGFEDETGTGQGIGCNVNYPLPEVLDEKRYHETLNKALKKVSAFGTEFLIVSLGLDPAKGDPTGSWSLLAKDFEINGKMIGALHLPTLVVQEGGYKTRSLGINARHFFKGLLEGSHEIKIPEPKKNYKNSINSLNNKGNKNHGAKPN